MILPAYVDYCGDLMYWRATDQSPGVYTPSLLLEAVAPGAEKASFRIEVAKNDKIVGHDGFMIVQ